MTRRDERGTASPMVVMVDRDLPFDSSQWQRLMAELSRDHVVMLGADSGVSEDDLGAVEVALLAKERVELLDRAPALRWVHCDQSGLSGIASRQVIDRMVVTGAAGRSADALAEHGLLFALMLAFDYPAFYAAQSRHEWRCHPSMANLRPLAGRTMGIIGLGNTGRALAGRARALDMSVLGYRRKSGPLPSGVSQVFCRDRGESIARILEVSDIVVLTVPLSDRTRGMIGREQLARMRSSSFLINLSRGEVIDQDALLWALQQRVIAGAGIDVTTPEPLPAGHPLWDAPNLLITPHFTPASPLRAERSLQIILENVKRYRNGAPLLNRLTAEDEWSGRD